ncbi:sensor histidine kinase [Pseudomonas sp. UL073]|uniref:Oxygen sensor histidine kinase NreB n=2 Tax=Zestomonas insulae TaxID=2809017 RepID=A0ABS2IBY0_9GAMM|nr:sensor histidine kinase [Pseudomonas insulae]
MAFVGHLVGTRIEHAAAASAGEAAALYMEAFLEPYVQELATDNELSPASVHGIDRLHNSTSLSKHIVSVKIWSADARILYSNDKSQLNQTFPHEEVARAMRGEIVTRLTPLGDDENHFEEDFDQPLYETYAPLRQFDTDRVLAVGEFYEQKHEIETLQQEVWAVISAATLAMLLLLFYIVRRGDLIIDRQQVALRKQMQEQEQLHRQNASLQQKITAANHEFARIGELTQRRLGADLHDGPAQLLTLILLRLDELSEWRPQPQPAAELDGDDALETIRGAAKDALRQVRNLSSGLALPELNDLSLTDELILAAHRHQQRTQSQVLLDIADLPEQMPPLHKIALYRFVEESLNNAFRHADGQGQRVSARCSNGLLTVEVCDSGPGFDPDTPINGTRGRSPLGLAGMRYRIESLGGSFKVDSSPGKGTRVSVQFEV